MPDEKVWVTPFLRQHRHQAMEEMTRQAFGTSFIRSKQQGICVRCQEPWLPKTHTQAGHAEYQISGLCEDCFGEIVAEDENGD